MNKAIFLDRDGIINVDKSYVYKIEDFEFNSKIFEVLKHFRSLGYLLVIVTNQSGIGRGYYSEEDFFTLTTWMNKTLEQNGIKIDKVYHCPHAPELHCDCRKPQSLMFKKAFKEFDINKENSWMIGDKPSDIKAGINAGMTNTIFVNVHTCKDAKYSVKSIFDTIKIINN